MASKVKTAKNSKLPKLSENCFELVGKGGCNGLHCVEVPHQMRKFLLNLAPGEPLALVQEMPCLNNPIKLDPLLVCVLDLCVHYMISGCMSHAVRVELCWC